MPEQPMEPLPDNSLLGELYKSRWEQVRHVNDLDQRSIVMVGSALAGLLIVYRDVMGLSFDLAIALSVLAAVICYGSIASVIHNRLSFEYYMASIDQMETRFNKVYPGLFPMAGHYKPPENYKDLGWRLLHSVRGSIIITFSVALCETIFLSLSPLLGPGLPHPYDFVLPLSAGVIIAIFVPFSSIQQNFKSAEKKFDKIRDVLETEAKSREPGQQLHAKRSSLKE